MQTFLTYYHHEPTVVFRQSAKDLDWQRLGKQRVEAYQILRTIRGRSEGWKNHPCTKMWWGAPLLLSKYHDTMLNEWMARGYTNNMQFQSAGIYDRVMPAWFTPELVLSHQSNLIRKKPEHYRPLWPDVPDDLPYIWPVT